MNDIASEMRESHNKIKPTSLDKILALSPIPVIGEIKAYKIIRYAVDTGKVKLGEDAIMRREPATISGNVAELRTCVYLLTWLTVAGMGAAISELSKRYF